MSPKDKGRVGRPSEGVGERQLGKLLESLGIFSEHIEGNGLPDRYIGRGRWIECKAFVFTRKDYWGRPTKLHTLLRGSQKRKIPKLIANGDQIFVCVFVHTEDEPTRFMIIPYERFLNINERQVDKESMPWRLSNPKVIEYVRTVLAHPDDRGNVSAKTITVTGLQDESL